MGNAIQAAQKAARKAIEATYAGVVTVSEYQKIKDPVTALTSYKEVVVLENQPCSLSLKVLQQRFRLGQWQPFHRRSSCSCHLTLQSSPVQNSQ